MNNSCDINGAGVAAVLCDKNGTSAMSPIDLNFNTLISHSVCCSIGLPLNLIIVYFIIGQRRLNRSKPRNMFQLNLVMCNILTLFTAIIEILYYFFSLVDSKHQHEMCLLFTSIVGLSYVAFFLNLLLSLIDRYVAISDPLWHRANVTIPLVLFCQISLTILFSLIVKWPYLSGLVNVECEIPLVALVTFQVTILVLFVSCVIARVVVYKKTKRYLLRRSIRRVSTAVVSSTRRRRCQLIEMETASRGLSVHLNESSVGGLELEATRSFITNVTVLLLLPCPLLVFSFSYLMCDIIPFYCECPVDSMIWLLPYFKELVLFHATLHPALLIFGGNKEFYFPCCCSAASGSTDERTSSQSDRDVMFG